MKNLKKLLAVIVAICVLATFTVPAFAEETTAAKTDAEIATELGVIQGEGGGVTADYLASQPTRLQGAIMFLRLKGLEAAAKAFTGTDNFDDATKVNDTNKAILAYLKANPDLGFQGVGNNTFAPLQAMTAKEYYKILLVALGYEEGTDFTWANVLSFAAGKGLVKLIDNEKFTVNDLCIGTVEALKATVKGGTDTLIAKLVEGNSIASDKAVASGLYNPVAKALEVVSATADTLKTAKIVFNKELDEDTVIKANFSNTNVNDVKLLDDKKTVVVVLTTRKTQSQTEDIVIENVKSVDGTKIAKVTKTVTFVDTTIPVITGAVAKNAKTIILSASEPLNAEYTYAKVWSDIKIDGVAIAASSAVDFAKNTVTLTLTSLLAKGTHKIDIAKLTDFADYTAVATSFNIDVAEDITPPSIVSAKMNNINEIEVTFNEDIDRLNQGDFYVNGVQATAASITQKATDASVFTIKVATLGIGSVVEVKVEYQNQKDVVGNKVENKTAFTFKVEDDTTLPTVTAAVGDGNKITLTFTKTMLKAGTVKIYKADGTTQLGSNVDLSWTDTSKVEWKTNNTVVDIKAGAIGNTDLSSTDAKDIVVKISGMKDATVRQNALLDVTLNLKALDSKKPTAASYYTTTAGTSSNSDDTATFYFNEAMDADTLKNLSNYVVTSAGGIVVAGPLSAVNSASVSSIASDLKSITLKIKGVHGSTAVFQVYAIKDAAGNLIDASSVSGSAPANLGISLAADAVKATANNKIEVKFDDTVGSFDPSVFTVREGTTNTTTLKAMVLSYTVDVSKVALTLDRSIGTTTTGLYLVPENVTLAKNVYGKELVATYKNIADDIDPTASLEAIGTTSVAIKFSEDVKVTTANAFLSDLTVRKASDNSLVTVAASDVLVYLNGTLVGTLADGLVGDKIVVTNLAANTEYKVSILPRGSIVDVSTYVNTLAELATTSVTTKSN